MFIPYLGAYGIDIADNPENAAEDADKLSKKLLENGVTGFCLTIISAKDGYKKVHIQQCSSHRIIYV